ncbi:PE-PPE domain-containing protein, partial [Mycobacterium sp.]|uniref:PE-PPE domain-containing protein n=1 Tax=Mycobacterium sp. TaxID=1785 RepID=UPI003F9752E0
AEGVSPSLVNFYIVGNPMNPNGGFFERFAGLQFQSIGLDFYGATPSNAYPTTMVTIEYDSWADFPRYPLDILSDLNAITSLNHFYYHVLTPQELNSAILLPGSAALGTPNSLTNYYMIPATDLPLLNPIRGIPIIGNPIADLLQPDLTYLVNLGYGDPLYGWSTSPANVPTQAGLLPPLSAFQELPGLLQSGAQLGMQNFIGDFTGTGPNPVTLPTLSSLASLLEHPSSSLTSLLGPLLGTTSGASAATGSATGLSALIANPLALAPGLSALIANPSPAALGTVVTNLANTVSGVASDVYSLAYPTADILTAAVISIPSYDVNLFLDGLLQAVNGQPVAGLMNAFGQPIASDIGLYLWLANLEAAVIANPTEAAGPATGVPAVGIN